MQFSEGANFKMDLFLWQVDLFLPVDEIVRQAAESVNMRAGEVLRLCYFGQAARGSLARVSEAASPLMRSLSHCHGFLSLSAR